MAKAGYCSECGANEWLRPDGSCVNGHPASSVSGVYDAPQEAASAALPAGAMTQSAWSRIPLLLKIVLAVVFLPFTIFYAIYMMWKQNRFSTAARVLLTAVGALMAFAMLSFAFGGNSPAPSPAPTPPSVTTPAATVTPAQPETESVSTEATAPSATEQVTPPPPPPVMKPAPAPSPPVAVTVYKTKTGSKYHMDGCRYLKSSKIAISLSAAKAQGLSP